jgi:hypothetical protein
MIRSRKRRIEYLQLSAIFYLFFLVMYFDLVKVRSLATIAQTGRSQANFLEFRRIRKFGHVYFGTSSQHEEKKRDVAREKRKAMIGLAKAVDRGQFVTYAPGGAVRGKPNYQALSGLPDREKSFIVLGIESSCDDTGAAIMTSDGFILGEALASQNDIHEKWGGVVPGLARDEHVAKSKKNFRWFDYFRLSGFHLFAQHIILSECVMISIVLNFLLCFYLVFKRFSVLHPFLTLFCLGCRILFLPITSSTCYCTTSTGFSRSNERKRSGCHRSHSRSWSRNMPQSWCDKGY